MKIFSAADLTNPNLDPARWGEYPQHLDRAVRVLNHIVRNGSITDEQAETRAANFRSLGNAFEMLKAGSTLMAEFNVQLTDIRPSATLHTPFSFPIDIQADVFRRSANPPIGTSKTSVPHSNHERVLPDSVYPERSLDELRRLQAEHLKRVEGIGANDSAKILYERRFTAGMTSEPFKYYQPDVEAIQALPKVEPYQTELTILDGIKLLIVTGYHRLEKPYGELFEKMFKEQVRYDPDKIAFLNIPDSDVPTGDQSARSNRKIQEAIQFHGATHVVDVHEQLAMGNSYIPHMMVGIAVKWREGSKASKGAGALEYTLDSFIPTHHIELAHQGIIVPPFQYTINQDVKEVELLVKDMKCSPAPRAGNEQPTPSAGKPPAP